MDKSDVVFVMVLITFIATVFIGMVVNTLHDTEHEYWISDSKWEAIDEGIESLVNGDVDSLIVTHPDKPGIVGYVYFRGE